MSVVGILQKLIQIVLDHLEQETDLVKRTHIKQLLNEIVELREKRNIP